MSSNSTRQAGASTDEAPVTLHRGWPVVGGLVLPAAILLVWWGVAASGWVPAYRLPSPAAVVAAGFDLAERGLFFQDIAISTQRVLTGFAFGAGIGLVLGALVGLSRNASILLSPLIGALRAVPSLAWLPLIVLYIGLGEAPKVVLVTIGAAFPVFTTLASALRHVDPHLVELGRAYGLRRVRLLTTVQLPAVIPALPEFCAELKRHYYLIGTSLGGNQLSPAEAKARGLPRPPAVILGNEEKGIAPGVAAACDRLVKIPGANTVESLNVSAAAAVLCWEFFGQR